VRFTTVGLRLFVALIVSVHTALAHPTPRQIWVAPPQKAVPPQTMVAVRGRVVDADNIRPLRRAIVSLARRDDRVRPVLTDEEGRFQIDVADPSSALVVAKAGYASTIVEPDGRTQPGRDLEIRLPRGAIISGRVIESGSPAIGARVIARPLEDASSTSPTYEADTDDRGEYRIGGLPAGQYVVGATNAPQVARILPGATVDREAVQGLVVRRIPIFPGMTPGVNGPSRLVDVHPGEETGDVDFETVALDIFGPAPRSAPPDLLELIEQGEGYIRGRVVTPFGRPIGGAMIAVSGNGQMRTVVADADGRFDAGRFKDGDYQIESGRLGYLTPDFRARPGSVPARLVHVGGDTHVHNLELVLAQGGAIAGTIVDTAGEPFQGVLVRALRLRQDEGRMVATIATWPRLTDDRGRYRLFGLPAGSYLIVAALDATESASGRSRAPGFAPVYYPGTAHVESAQPVQVELEGETSGTDLTFAVTSTARVTGAAVTSSDHRITGRVSLAVSHRSGSVAAEPRYAIVGAEGKFEFADVAPGDYVLQVHGEPVPGVPREFGAEYLTVGDSDPPPLEIKTAAGSTLEGRFVADGRASIPMRAQSVHAAPMDIDRSPPGGRGPDGLAVHDDGRFYLTGLFGAMRLTYPSLPGWYLKSITIAGVDVTDAPFDFGFSDETFADAEIVLSQAGGTISGSIEGASRRRLSPAIVVAFPVDRLSWFAGSRYFKQARSREDGSFEVDGLPPGEYFVAAVDALTTDDWQSPHALEALVPQAMRVTLRERQVQTVTLRTGRP
jgi:hypothetical protein